MVNSLEERLKAHANAFDGLLSLIPAKYYYDDDTSNQWKQKRKSKEERKQNKRKKLDPNQSNEVTAEEVLRNREKEAVPVTIPGTKVVRKEEKKDTKMDKKDIKMDKKDIKMDKKDIKMDKKDIKMDKKDIKMDTKIDKKDSKKDSKKELNEEPKKEPKKELSEEEKKEKEKHLAELRSKLSAKISSMRARRKAPGTNVPGAATSRQQILDERRRKWQLKNMKKEEEKKTGKEGVPEVIEAEEEDGDEDSSSDEEAESSASSVFYGNIEFGDGEKVRTDLSGTRRTKVKKGTAHKDLKGNLNKIWREKEKMNNVGAEKREALEKKKQWSHAMASVEGIKIKDDEQLLKKALKRKEAVKRKTKRQWGERVRGVREMKHAKEDRRQENIRIRKENKGKSSKDQVKQLPSHKKLSRAYVKRARAGFEGRLKRK
ncbi:hypothetical protein FOA43_004255 [Brettanomyces nanus]|uniref:Surfeit locus protein 6 n=1 Tax=Eeniella nana TaxID=13502 RepID=A0A875S5F5_EENNA|nr:uncharacterized protein FOA43_004255 [Brettanomyces nanus]QPG76861.1 hypothetical protein FOA43_004255 [Brettanomyces nanus]